MSEVILYDLPSKGRCACWSLNPWKPRLFLNLKGIPYKTQWIEYPDLAPTFKAFGIPPNAKGPGYTSPTIRIGDKYVMDSQKIAIELEKQYPSPSLHLDSPLLPKVEELVSESLELLKGVLKPKVPGRLLNQASEDYWVAKQEAKYGMSLSQLEKREGGDVAWENATPVMKELGSLLKAEGGPFVLGKTVSYSDLVIVGFLQFMRCIREDIYERVVEIEPALRGLYEASKKWLERDDH